LRAIHDAKIACQQAPSPKPVKPILKATWIEIGAVSNVSATVPPPPANHRDFCLPHFATTGCCATIAIQRQSASGKSAWGARTQHGSPLAEKTGMCAAGKRRLRVTSSPQRVDFNALIWTVGSSKARPF
jgi:hypothetical protein